MIRFIRTVVTPDMAKLWLTKNLSENRRASTASVAAYAEEITAGRWKETHEAIAFDEKGRLIDGQQRLQAIIAAGKSVTLFVARGVPCEGFDAINGGKPRTGTDIARWMGYADRLTLRSAVVRRLVLGVKRTRMVNTKYKPEFQRFTDGLDFVMEMFPKKIQKITQAPVLAAIARAYYSVETSKLAAFCKVLRDGRYSNTERAAHVHREWLKDLDRGGGGQTQDEIYLKTGQAIREYLDRNKSVKNITMPTEEVFALPWDEKAAS